MLWNLERLSTEPLVSRRHTVCPPMAQPSMPTHELSIWHSASPLNAAREVHEAHAPSEGKAAHIRLWCDDVDSAFEKAPQVGARSVRGPYDFQGGRLRDGWALDLACNLVEVVRQLW